MNSKNYFIWFVRFVYRLKSGWLSGSLCHLWASLKRNGRGSGALLTASCRPRLAAARQSAVPAVTRTCQSPRHRQKRLNTTITQFCSALSQQECTTHNYQTNKIEKTQCTTLDHPPNISKQFIYNVARSQNSSRSTNPYSGVVLLCNQRNYYQFTAPRSTSVRRWENTCKTFFESA